MFGLQVSWTKPKVQVFETVKSVRTCGENVEIWESFSSLGSAAHNCSDYSQTVPRLISLAYTVVDSYNTSTWRCRCLCGSTHIRIFSLFYADCVTLFPVSLGHQTVAWRNESKPMVISTIV